LPILTVAVLSARISIQFMATIFNPPCDSRPAACSELAAMNSNNLGGTLFRPFPKSMQGQVDAPLRR
jgi:hypothetical protein